MISLKNYYVPTTKEIDFVPILNDIRFAIRDSTILEGIVTITLPEEGAGLWISAVTDKEILKKRLQETASLPQRSLSFPFQKKELLLGPKEMIYLIDKTDAGKRREFHVTLQGEVGDKPEGQPRAAGKPARPQQGRGQ